MLRSAGSRFLWQAGQVARQQQRFAQAQATKDLDWDELNTLVTSDEGKRELAALRTTFFDLRSKGEGSKVEATINWDQFKDDVEPETLSLFKKTYEGLKFDKYDIQKDISEARAAFEPLYKQADELADFSSKRIKEIDEELKQIEEEKAKITTLTIDEELAADPELAKEIDREISEGNYLP